MANDGNYNHSVSKPACEMLQFYRLEIHGVKVASFQTDTCKILFPPNCSLIPWYNILLHNNIAVIDILLILLQSIFFAIRKITVYTKHNIRGL